MPILLRLGNSRTLGQARGHFDQKLSLTPAQVPRAVKTLRQDDPTQEIGAAWGIKEQLRTLLACGSLADAREEKMRLGYYVIVADMPETWRLWETIIVRTTWPGVPVWGPPLALRRRCRTRRATHLRDTRPDWREEQWRADGQ